MDERYILTKWILFYSSFFLLISVCIHLSWILNSWNMFKWMYCFFSCLIVAVCHIMNTHSQAYWTLFLAWVHKPWVRSRVFLMVCRRNFFCRSPNRSKLIIAWSNIKLIIIQMMKDHSRLFGLLVTYSFKATFHLVNLSDFAPVFHF